MIVTQDITNSFFQQRTLLGQFDSMNICETDIISKDFAVDGTTQIVSNLYLGK